MEISKTKLNFDVDKCPCCKTGTLIRVMSFDANAPPVLRQAQVDNGVSMSW